MTQLQDNYFLDGEGDAWFKRNQTYLKETTDIDWPLFLMEKYELNPKTVLEVGCSNGWRLGKILDAYPDVHCVGIEPSAEAIVDGREQFKSVKFHNGTAAEIPVTGKFDLVIVNFVLHWISRETILKSLAEIDRLVKDDGYLIIGDFLPDSPGRSFYHHLPEAKLFTYKMDYPKLFTSTNLYQTVASLTFNHSSKKLEGQVVSQNRGGCALLRKSLQEFYPEVKLPN